MATELCNEKHKAINEKIDEHEKRLDEHDQKIDRLDRSDAANSTNIDNLCSKISDLVGTIKWLIGISVSTIGAGIIGFFFYAIQSHLFGK